MNAFSKITLTSVIYIPDSLIFNNWLYYINYVNTSYNVGISGHWVHRYSMTHLNVLSWVRLDFLHLERIDKS